MIYDIIVVGGGASGFFSAISIKERLPNVSILILEKTNKLLSKVKVSGGGRCNVTHYCLENHKLVTNYPRGNQELISIFEKFDVEDTIEWFKKREVLLKIEPDGRMFPSSNSSQTIIDCFLDECEKRQIDIKIGYNIASIFKKDSIFELRSKEEVFSSKSVIVATGGFPKIEGYDFLKCIDVQISPPIPSLFTFNDKNLFFKHLAGVSVKNAKVSIKGSDFSFTGPLLITHWGFSGPSVLKLSAFAAEFLHDKKYNFVTQISWNGLIDDHVYKAGIVSYREKNPKKNIYSNPLFDIPKRLWEALCQYSEIEPIRNWSEIGNKKLELLITNLTSCEFNIEGKTTFKDEFVTCGGVDFENIDIQKLEHKFIKGLFFCGEVLNMDGITGGYNFQAAWSSAWIVSQNIMKND